jgi:single-strand DNA-binding protein
VVAWQRLAEIAGEYLKKGRSVYIEGRLQTRSWEDKNTKEKKYATEIVAQDLVLLGGGQGGGGGQHEDEGNSRSRGSSSNAGQGQAQPTPDYESATQITDDDIPF